MSSDEKHPALRACLYSYGIYHLFTENPEAGTGGAEFQMQELGRRLKKRGMEVLYLVGDFGQPDRESRDGFMFVKAFPPSSSGPLGKALGRWRALRSTQADVFIERGASDFTFWLAAHAMLSRKKFIFCGASDIDFAADERPTSVRSWLSWMMYRAGLRCSSAIVVQKQSQGKLLAENFGISGVVIRNFVRPFMLPSLPEKEYDVIWIASFLPYKQPELVLLLAQSLPGLRFVMIGGARDARYFEDLRTRALAIRNLGFLGYVPPAEVDRHISRSSILINTTLVRGKYEEGFPNTFLRAWQAGIPVVSLAANPDGILTKLDIGRCPGSVEGMAADISALMLDAELRRQMGERGKRYVRENHDGDAIEAHYLEVIRR